jgi:ABC-type sugar transport system ATPase subunit
MNAVELRGVSKSYGQLTVLRDLNLMVEVGTFTVVLGAPASGKSVLVRLLTGLEKPDAGQIFLRGADSTKVDSGGRNIGYVPQSFALYPHYSVYDNIAYPLNLIKFPKPQIDTAVRQISEQLKIDHLLKKRPDQLSGGEKQRVALARGVVKHSDIYILDDTLVGLDFKLREQLFDDLKEMQESLLATFVYTTSDPLETLAMADNAAILDGGGIVEVGPLEQLYRCPKHMSTMQLLGFPSANLIAGDLYNKRGGLWCRTSLFEFPVEAVEPVNLLSEREHVNVIIRPEGILLNMQQDALLRCQAKVVLLEDLGGEVIVYLDVDGTRLLTVVSHIQDNLITDEALSIGIRPSSAVLFRPDTGERIGQGAE